MVKKCLLLLCMWGSFGCLTAQNLIGLILDSQDDFKSHLIEMDLSNCTILDTIAPVNTFYDYDAIAYGPDSNFYSVDGAGSKTLYRIDGVTGEEEELLELPNSSGGNYSGASFRESGDLILGASGPVRLAVYNIYSEEITEVYDSFPALGDEILSLGVYGDRLFATNYEGIFEVNLEEKEANLLAINPNSDAFRGIEILELECGEPVLALISEPEFRITYYFVKENRFEIQCEFPSFISSVVGENYVGLTSRRIGAGFPGCQDTIDLDAADATASGYDFAAEGGCGSEPLAVVHSSVDVYGEMPMDSIRLLLLDEPDGGAAGLTAPELVPLTVTGSGTDELMASGPANFQNYEVWLQEVEYTNTSQPPTSGERRVAVIGYFSGGMTTDTAYAYLTLQNSTLSAGADASVEYCPSESTVDLSVHLEGADPGGRWLPDSIIELDPTNSGDYLYIVSDSCSADTARLEVFIWPGPEVSLEGPDQLCFGESGELRLSGDLSMVDSYRWNTGSEDSVLVVDRSGVYVLEITYGEDCRWRESLVVEVNDRIERETERELCPGDTVYWRGEEITEAGEYEQMSSGGTGCDTLFRLRVEADSREERSESYSLCMGEEIELYGERYDRAGSYEIVLPSGEGCDTLVTIEITERDAIRRMEEQRVCAGEQGNYEGEELAAGETHVFALSGGTGCDTILEIRVIEERAEAEISGPGRLCSEEERLEVGGMEEVSLFRSEWNTGAVGEELWVEAPGRYRWEGESETGCAYSAEIEIEECRECSVAIPNAFSPNGDGVNDVLEVSTSCQLQDFRAEIYDRWGEKLAESRNASAIWDGDGAGAGVYVYRIEYEYEGPSGWVREVEHGTVALLR